MALRRYSFPGDGSNQYKQTPFGRWCEFGQVNEELNRRDAETERYKWALTEIVKRTMDPAALSVARAALRHVDSVDPSDCEFCNLLAPKIKGVITEHLAGCNHAAPVATEPEWECEEDYDCPNFPDCKHTHAKNCPECKPVTTEPCPFCTTGVLGAPCTCNPKKEQNDARQL
jgi:hypothetical protein